MIIACKHLKGINTGEGEELAQGEETDPGIMGEIKTGEGRWVSWQSSSRGVTFCEFFLKYERGLSCFGEDEPQEVLWVCLLKQPGREE